MATLLSSIETQARRHLIETTASFWSSAEIIDIENKGIFDLWRDIVNLKEEHFLTIDTTNVSLAADTSTLTGVPADVHKVYLIEPLDTSPDSDNRNLEFIPKDYHHVLFKNARTRDPIDPSNDTIFYAPIGAGAPTGTGSTTIQVAPQVNAAVSLRFCYVPVIAALTASGTVPIPGEADNALIAWTVAFARAKEREDRSPDPSWLAVYATEKAHLLESLGLRQLQEPKIVDGLFDDYWS